ncbi:Maf family protein [Rhizosaccharibacter radicis]|uniref:dTTP/UTP pyrophosphatase n=1 Tax=Rhizosaccharibacter radicis TaxID=2782605 RepID=A0ABT1VW61_9PROT|nr:Maf family nucleotide pyrophosphatase [Acetobacteraceae bacterium KSS12]
MILASASPRRRDLLAQIGIVPDAVLATDTDETPRRDELPRPYAQRIARTKAASALTLRRDAGGAPGFVLAADTVVALGRRILPKADDTTTARHCLELLSGRRHTVITAVVLHAPDGGRSERLVESVVAFNRMTVDQIDALLAGGDWSGKAGGYAIQGHAAAHIRFLSGSHSNVVGLPLFETAQLLRGRGWAV